MSSSINNRSQKPQIADIDKCTGCAACHDVCDNSAITMEYDHEGFLVPYIDKNKCVSCNKCSKICPSINNEHINTDFVKKVYISWNKNLKQRRKSSSGGIFPVFADYILSQSGYVYGAKYNDKMQVVHTYVNNRDDLKRLSGSKYVQSDLRGIYRNVKNVLELGHPVFFSGLPCQIAALYSFLGNKVYGKLYTCELLCLGVPSPGIFQSYILFQEKRENVKVTNIDFRNKLISWEYPRLKMSYKHRLPRIALQTADPFVAWFGLRLSIRRSCFHCIYRVEERNADITMGDYWGIQSLKPYLTRKNGISALFINSKKGEDILDKISSYIYLEPSSFSDVNRGNLYLSKNYPNS
jgi:coenzyme F420-reducing hydrogenase beta subunit